MARENGITISNSFIQTPVVGFTNIPPPPKKKRNLPGTPDPAAEVVALSPETLMATNRFVCEICEKGFQREQNLQLHRRGHNLPWKLKQRSSKEPVRKRVYVCPVKTCVHHQPSRALGDLTGIKKHFCRKHGEKKWKCDKCSKRYAVQSDCKAHSKTCGSREYKCGDCGTIFSRRDSFLTHRAFCEALAEETARVNAASNFNITTAFANTSLNYSFNGGGMMAGGPTVHQHSSSIFRPLSTKSDDQETTITSTNNQQIQNERGSPLPLWTMEHQLSQPPPHNLASNSSGNNNVIHHDEVGYSQHGSNSINCFYLNPPLVSCSNLQQAQDDSYQMSWVFGSSGGNKLSSNTDGKEVELLPTSTSSFPLMSTSDGCRSTMREELVGSSTVPSLFSSQHDHQQKTPSIMSATALLQKAAQIGATSTDPLFLGNLRGINKADNTNEIQDHDITKYGGGSGKGEIGEGHGSSSTTTTTKLVGSDVESSTNYEFAHPINQMDMHNPLKRRRVMQSSHQDLNSNYLVGGGGQTRDFLGVGIQPTCHVPSPIKGWI